MKPEIDGILLRLLEILRCAQDDTRVQPEIDSAPLMLDHVIKGRSYSDCRRVLDPVQTPQS